MQADRKRRALSLALRLTLLFTVAAAVIFIIFGGIISRSMEMHFEAGDNSELNIITNTVIKALLTANTRDDVSQLKHRFDDILIGHHSASLYITSSLKETIYSGQGPDLSILGSDTDGQLNTGGIQIWNNSGHAYRVLVKVIREAHITNGYTIIVAVPIDFHVQFLKAFQKTLWLMVAAGISIMCFMGWIAARRGHAPLYDIVGRIRKVTANRLDSRLSADKLPKELSDLAYSFNAMLQRVDDSFQRLSDFNADIAHELRTPVTNMLTQTQVALSRDRSKEEYREILYSNMEEYDRMAHMVSDMLFLAKADDGLTANEITTIQLEAEIDELYDYYQGWAEERGVTLTVEGTAHIAGDRNMLRRAFANLLANAIRHTTPGNTVHTIITRANKMIVITITNPGLTIPSEHLPRIFDRFYRVDSSRKRDEEGSGLGLSIVKTIIDTHHGDIQVSSRDGRTRFTLTLPEKQQTVPIQS